MKPMILFCPDCKVQMYPVMDNLNQRCPQCQGEVSVRSIVMGQPHFRTKEELDKGGGDCIPQRS